MRIENIYIYNLRDGDILSRLLEIYMKINGELKPTTAEGVRYRTLMISESELKRIGVIGEKPSKMLQKILGAQREERSWMTTAHSLILKPVDTPLGIYQILDRHNSSYGFGADTLIDLHLYTVESCCEELMGYIKRRMAITKGPRSVFSMSLNSIHIKREANECIKDT